VCVCVRSVYVAQVININTQTHTRGRRHALTHVRQYDIMDIVRNRSAE